MVVTTVFFSLAAKLFRVLTRFKALLESNPEVGSWQNKSKNFLSRIRNQSPFCENISQCHLGLHGAPNQGWTGIRYRVVLHYSVLSEDYSKLGLRSLLH